jgi:hypothetical protein
MHPVSLLELLALLASAQIRPTILAIREEDPLDMENEPFEAWSWGRRWKSFSRPWSSQLRNTCVSAASLYIPTTPDSDAAISLHSAYSAISDVAFLCIHSPTPGSDYSSSLHSTYTPDSDTAHSHQTFPYTGAKQVPNPRSKADSSGFYHSNSEEICLPIHPTSAIGQEICLSIHPTFI